jgi:large subunit ribosomal protein L21
MRSFSIAEQRYVILREKFGFQGKIRIFAVPNFEMADELYQDLPGRQTLTVETFNKFYNMFAIVDIASQQFKVEAGMDIFVNRLTAKNGESVEFDKVLLVDNEGKVKVGTPYVKGAKVQATVVDDDAKAKKVLVFKKIRRKGFQTLNGHRQKLTKIHIDAIA